MTPKATLDARIVRSLTNWCTAGLLILLNPVLQGQESNTKTEEMREDLQPERMGMVTPGKDRELRLAPIAFAPKEDDPNRIVISMTSQDAGTETMIPADDLAAAKEVKTTEGQYFFRVDRAGIYEAALVAKFPHPGTWTLQYQYDDSVQRGTVCRVSKGQEKALHILPVPAMRKGLKGGAHQLKISIPGAGEIRAIVLQRGEPLAAAAVKKAPSANSFRPEKGTVHFRPIRPIGAELIEGIKWPGSKGRIEWKIVDTKGQVFTLAEIAQARAQEVVPLNISATLYRETSGESARLRSPQILYQVNPEAMARVTNDQLSLEVDRRSGRIGKLIHRPSGRIFRRMAELPFRLMEWDADVEALVPIDPERFVCRSVEDGDDTLTLTYEDVGLKQGTRTVIFRIESVGEQLHCSMQVDNQTNERIRLVRFPYMSGIAASGEGEDDVIAWAGQYLGPAKKTPGYLKDYHTPMLMYVSLSGDGVGFYLGAHDATGEADRMVMQPTVGKPPYDYTVEVNHTIEPGDNWESQTHVIALPDGDWHAAADLYRKWYRTIPRHVTDPAWLRNDYPGALNIYLSPGEPFSSIVDWWKQTKWRGTFFLKLNGVGGDGFGNNFYPYPSPLSGGPEQLGRVMEWVNAQGGQASAYMNMRYYTPSWGDESTLIGWTPRWLFPEDKELNRLHDREWTMRNALYDLDGTVSEPIANGGPHRPFQPIWKMSFRSQGWYDYWQYWIPYYAQLGLNVYWDQAMLTSYRCDLPPGQRRDPDANFSQGALATARDAVDKARQYKSDFVIRGEGLNDRMMRYLNLGWLFLPGMINPIYRYTLPDQVLDQTVYTGDYQKQCEEGFLYQMRIIGGAPWGKGWGMDMRDLTQLRLATHDVAFPGRYMDNVALKGESPERRARYVVLETPERKAVCVNTVNRTEQGDAWPLELDWPFDAPPRSAFVYTQPNRVRALPFSFEDGVLRFQGPDERLASLVIIAQEDPKRPLRIAAYMPMDIPGKEIVRVSLANVSDHEVKGRLRLEPNEVLKSAQEAYPLKLKAGAAKVLDIPITGTSDLQDFTQLPVEIDLGKDGRMTAIVEVAPTLPNGQIELDELGDAVPDYWKTGVRLPHEDGSGYCLSVAAPGDFSIRDYVQVPVHLRPNTRYRVRFRARTNTDKVHASVFERDLHNKNMGTHLFRLPESKEWTEHHFDFTTGPKADAGFSILTFRCTSKNRREAAWIDDVRLEIVGAADRLNDES